MAITPVIHEPVLLELVGPIWAVDNPEYYAKRKDSRCKSGPNADLLLERSKERKRKRMEKEKAAAEMAALRDELSSDEYQYPDDAEFDDDKGEDSYFHVDSRIRIKPRYGTVLELNPTTIFQYLKPFKAQLNNLSTLAEFPDLRPYVSVAPAAKRSTNPDSSSDESSMSADAHDEPFTTRRRGRSRVSTAKIIPYPLTGPQASVLEQLRNAHTLIFTTLPSTECVMKLIFLSVQASKPYYDQVLFPNVKKVIFYSAMQEKSLQDRYANLGSTTPPHPITFALDWLVNDFSLCIHSVSSTFKSQWIDKQVRSDTSGLSGEAAAEKYRKTWMRLNPLAGTMSIERLPRLQSISYHNILPGDRPRFSKHVETYLYFGRYEGPDTNMVEATLRAIAKPMCDPTKSDMLFGDTLHLINIEYLGLPTPRKLGPKAVEKGLKRRIETLRCLFRHVVKVHEVEHGYLDTMMGNEMWAMLQSGANEELCDSLCDVCMDVCEESSCNPIDDCD